MKVLIEGESGSLWGRKPAVDKEGTIVSFSRSPDTRIRLTCVAFAAHTSDIVVGDSDGCSWVIHLKANRFSLLVSGGPPCSSVACHPSRNDEAIMGHSNGHLVVLNTRSKSETNLLRSHRTTVSGIVYSSSLEYIASISCDALIVWNAKVRDYIVYLWLAWAHPSNGIAMYTAVSAEHLKCLQRHTKLRDVKLTNPPADVGFSMADDQIITVSKVPIPHCVGCCYADVHHSPTACFCFLAAQLTEYFSSHQPAVIISVSYVLCRMARSRCGHRKEPCPARCLRLWPQCSPTMS